MLNYHLLLPNIYKHKEGVFIHYLSLGSHKSSFQLQFIDSLSIIAIKPKERIPQIMNNQDKIYKTLVVPLKGNIKIDQNKYNQQFYQKQIIIQDAKNISTIEQYQKQAIFLYITCHIEKYDKLKLSLCRYDQQKVQELLQNDIVLLLEGKLTYHQNQLEVVIKSKYSLEEPVPVFYAVQKGKIKIDKDSIVFRIRSQQ